MFRIVLFLFCLAPMLTYAADTNVGPATCYTADELQKKIASGFKKEPWQKVVSEKKSAVTFYGGVGMNVVPDIDATVPRWMDVGHAIPGLAGHKAGIRDRDRITKIDGRPVSGFPNDQAIVRAIRGKVGTVVVLTIDRPGGATFTARVKRESTPDIHEVECFRIVTPPGKSA